MRPATVPISMRRCALGMTAAQSWPSSRRSYVERDRHQVAENPAQQHPRLLHRGDGRATPSRSCGAAARRAFRHRQTMASAVRFTTAELQRDRGPHCRRPAERALAIEQDVFAELAAAIARAGASARASWPARWRSSTSMRRWRSLPRPRATRAPCWMTARRSRSAAAAIRWSSRR